MEAAIRYNKDVVVAMEICRQIPSFLVPYRPLEGLSKCARVFMLTFISYVAPAILAWSGAMKKVAAFIRPLIEQRLHEAWKPGEDFETHVSTFGTGRGINPLTEEAGLHSVDHRLIPRREATNRREARSTNHCSSICFGASDANGKLQRPLISIG